MRKWRARAAAYAVTIGSGLVFGFAPGFQIAGLFTGGTVSTGQAATALGAGVATALLLFRPWGAFGGDR